MFSKIASTVARLTGRPTTFILACLLVIVWGALGPACHYSDSWQLWINTPTTIITTLLVILERNTSSREMAALHIKLDELIETSESSRNVLVGVENKTEREIEALRRPCS